MISEVSLLSGKPKKALCLIARVKKCIGVSSSELHKEQRGEETFFFYLSI